MGSVAGEWEFCVYGSAGWLANDFGPITAEYGDQVPTVAQ